MDQRTDASRHLLPGLGDDARFDTGRELFVGRSADGEVVTFVCYRDGYGIRLNGLPVPNAWWDTEEMDAALTAFQVLTRAGRRPATPLPAA